MKNNLTLRDVIPKREVRRALGYEYGLYVTMKFGPPVYRVGKFSFYLLDDVMPLAPNYIPIPVPDIPLNRLRTSTQIGDYVGLCREAVYKNSDYNGGHLPTVQIWDSRLWIFDDEILGEFTGGRQCNGISLTGERCKNTVKIGTQTCWQHSQNQSSK